HARRRADEHRVHEGARSDLPKHQQENDDAEPHDSGMPQQEAARGHFPLIPAQAGIQSWVHAFAGTCACGEPARLDRCHPSRLPRASKYETVTLSSVAIATTK